MSDPKVTLRLSAREINCELWLATLSLHEDGKTDNTRDFVVNEQQLAFLNLLAKEF